MPKRYQSADINEFTHLVESADIKTEFIYLHKLKNIQSKYFCKTWVVSEIKELIRNLNADLVIFSYPISATNQKNLVKSLCVQVLDINEVILDIFAQRAQSKEGKLQVELAQLLHLSSKLIKGWTHLERQKGGIGLRGPGEKQLETDRRLIRNRIKLISQDIKAVEKTRHQNSARRRKQMIPLVALIGYTNAGKSSLFNHLTQEDTLSESKLFATLDPLVRKLTIPNLQPIQLIDTVGFIHSLPDELKQAFKSTLDLIKSADLLIHVIDGSNPNYRKQIEDVENIIDEMQLNETPIIAVHNKSDITEDKEPKSLSISTVNGKGIPELIKQIKNHFHSKLFPFILRIPIQKEYILSEINKNYQTLPNIKYTKDKITFTALIPKTHIKPYSSYLLR